jgi:hypothetical protein
MDRGASLFLVGLMNSQLQKGFERKGAHPQNTMIGGKYPNDHQTTRNYQD